MKSTSSFHLENVLLHKFTHCVTTKLVPHRDQTDVDRQVVTSVLTKRTTIAVLKAWCASECISGYCCSILTLHIAYLTGGIIRYFTAQYSYTLLSGQVGRWVVVDSRSHEV